MGHIGAVAQKVHPFPARCSRFFLSGPSPTTSNFTSGFALFSCSNALNSIAWFFIGSRRPTTPITISFSARPNFDRILFLLPSGAKVRVSMPLYICVRGLFTFIFSFSQISISLETHVYSLTQTERKRRKTTRFIFCPCESPRSHPCSP